MREFKFRAWYKKKMYVVDDLCYMRIQSEIYFNDMSGENINLVPDELMQFTGLKDKNGKEIYEGDILKWIAVGKEGGNVEDIGVKTDMGNYEVVFEDGKFTTIKPNIAIGHFENKEIEIIGNIYENKELM